jgi:hypothetical protein
MFKPNKIIKNFAFFLSVIAISLTLSITVLAVWQDPTLAPPDGNKEAPVNVSAEDQTKDGSLSLNLSGVSPMGLFVNRNAYFMNGKIGIGTETPEGNLDIAGDAAVSGGAATLSTGGYTDTVTITGGNFDNLVEGSQLIVNFGGSTPFDDVRTVKTWTDSTHVKIDQKTNWAAATFKYIKYPQGVKTTGALTVGGTVSLLGSYEGVGGIYIPTMDMLIGGGTDGIFKIRQEDIATKPYSTILFGSHKEDVATSNTMIIDTRNARVGIGTMDTTYRNINTGANSTAALIVRQSNNENGHMLLLPGVGKTDSDYGFGIINNAGRQIRTASIDSTSTNVAGTETGSLRFETKPSASDVQERMRITQDGQVGIGTPSPSGALTVKSSDAVMGEMTFFDDTPGFGDISSTGGSDSLFTFNNAGAATGATYFRAQNGVDPILYLMNAGNVGIGLPNPGQKLTVNGSVGIGSGAANDAGAPGKATCIVTATRKIGVCSTQPDATGSCTCNAIN